MSRPRRDDRHSGKRPGHRLAPSSSTSLLTAAPPVAPRGYTLGRRHADPLLRASRSLASLRPPLGSGVTSVGAGGGTAPVASSPLGGASHGGLGVGFGRSPSIAPASNPKSPDKRDKRPRTPGGTLALRSKFEAARLTDENITLSEDVQRLSSTVSAHMRFHSRAEAASTTLEQKYANMEKELARVRDESAQLGQQLVKDRKAAKETQKRLEAMLAVSKQGMTNLRSQVDQQQQQIRRLSSALERTSDDTGTSGGEPESAPPPTAVRASGRPPTAKRPGSAGVSGAGGPNPRRLSLSLALASQLGGNSPLLVSPMRSPCTTPRAGSGGGTPRSARSTDSGGDGPSSQAHEMYALQAQVAELRAGLEAERAKVRAADAERKLLQEKSDAYRGELANKDTQMASLRERVAELEAAAGTGGDAGGDDGADGGGFEEVLREEMDSMRASYQKRLNEARDELQTTQQKNARREEYWKDQLNDAKQRYLGLQMQYERLQRRLNAATASA